METKDIRFWIDVSTSSGFGDRYMHLKATVCTVRPGTSDPEWPHFYDYNERRFDAMDGLGLKGQLDKDSSDWYPCELYGTYGLKYRDRDMSVKSLEAGLKILRPTIRRLEKMDEQLGRANDFIGNMVRCCKALGAIERNCFGRRADYNQYTDTDVLWVDADNIRWWIESKVNEWKGQ